MERCLCRNRCEPGPHNVIFRNNENLNRLAEKIVSPLMFAHVRAAYPGMPVSEQNCHPFMYNNYLWMHNGVIGGFNKVARGMQQGIGDDMGLCLREGGEPAQSTRGSSSCQDKELHEALMSVRWAPCPYGMGPCPEFPARAWAAATSASKGLYVLHESQLAASASCNKAIKRR